MHCLQNFITEEILDKHKKQCLLINGTQAVNCESGIIKLKNYEKQVPIVFKIYADTECFLKRSNSFEGEHTIKYQERFPNSIGVKLVCIDNRFTLPTIIFKGKKCVNEFIKWDFRQKEWTNKVIYQHFNKDLRMTNEDEEIEINSDICHMQRKIRYRKIRDYSTITGKFRGASHSKCSKYLDILKKLTYYFS